ncbi:MAG: outer membrane beta-barrel protein, partial [Bacteroidota bacterium]
FNTGMMAKHFSLMASALYSNRGFKYEYDTTFTYSTPVLTGGTISSTVNETVDVDATLGYLDVPVMITFFTKETGGFFIQAGPQFSYLITDKAQINSSAVVSTDGSQPSPTDPTTKNDVTFNKSDIAAIGGIGYKFEKVLLIYARASTGFLKTQKDGFISDSNSGHNITYQAGIALVFQ